MYDTLIKNYTPQPSYITKTGSQHFSAKNKRYVFNATYDGACFDDGDFDYVMMYRSTMRSHSLTTLIFLGSNSHFSFVMWNYLGG